MGNAFWKSQSGYFRFTIEDRKLRGKILPPVHVTTPAALGKVGRFSPSSLRIVKDCELCGALLGGLLPGTQWAHKYLQNE